MPIEDDNLLLKLKKGEDIMLINATIILCLVGKFLKDDPIKKINSFGGYRTKKSMANQYNWDVAQKKAFELMYKIFFLISTIFIPFTIIDILSLIGFFEDSIFTWSLVFQGVNIIIGFILIFVLTEKELSVYGKY